MMSVIVQDVEYNSENQPAGNHHGAFTSRQGSEPRADSAQSGRSGARQRPGIGQRQQADAQRRSHARRLLQPFRVALRPAGAGAGTGIGGRRQVGHGQREARRCAAQLRDPGAWLCQPRTPGRTH